MKRLQEVREAIETARRFIERAEIVAAEIDATPRIYWGGKNHASMKRAALDLAKVLPPLQRTLQ